MIIIDQMRGNTAGQNHRDSTLLKYCGIGLVIYQMVTTFSSLKAIQGHIPGLPVVKI